MKGLAFIFLRYNRWGKEKVCGYVSDINKSNQYTTYNKSRKKFYLSQREDCSPAASFPDYPEELL